LNDEDSHLAFAAVMAAQQVQELGRVDRVTLDVLLAAFDFDGAGVNDDITGPHTRQCPVQPEVSMSQNTGRKPAGTGGPWLDFVHVKKQLSLEKVLAHLGATPPSISSTSSTSNPHRQQRRGTVEHGYV
jgi:hypothetical protein